MQRILFVFFAVCLALMPEALAVETPEFLPAAAYPLQISFQGGSLWAINDDDDRLHDGWEFTGRLTYDLNANVAIGAETGLMGYEDRSNGITYGHLYGVPVLADLVLKAPILATGNHLVPYIYGAAGFMDWHYDKSSFSDGTGVEAHNRVHFAVKPGAGMDYYITPNVAVFVEASYLFTKSYVLKNGSRSPPNGKLDPDSFYAGGGIKVAF